MLNYNYRCQKNPTCVLGLELPLGLGTGIPAVNPVGSTFNRGLLSEV